ncbi:predicted protein [Uncinocarpus reesii 1704]|uniref:Uncharacterized protein n=1 Tax=Uncinocarpus reesii (strain UAMH 1704) TaxID=336963 RepID=C4JI12_UNCRE|nr:uncharacterized protein UREG_01437 [Uncinocarpus reesii 1704]EEP76588.1 predicted protein [Uncinocarpus reesii 1704]
MGDYGDLLDYNYDDYDFDETADPPSPTAEGLGENEYLLRKEIPKSERYISSYTMS